MGADSKHQDIDFKQILRDNGLPVDQAQVLAEFHAEVEKNHLITNTSRMSPFWRLISALVVNPYLWIVDTLVNSVLKNLFLLTASGAFVDLFAASYNLTRKPASAATGLIRFSKKHPAQTLIIDAGTLIRTERINGVIYQVKTLEKTLIPPGVSSALVSVQATDTGSAFNLAPGYYQILAEDNDNVASVRNGENWLITPGDDTESDRDLKNRCRNQFNLAGNYHTDAVYRSMISAQTGLNTGRIFFQHDAPRGPGTANAYLLLDTGVISQPYIDKINHYIMTQGHHGHGDDMRCFALPETRHDLQVIIYVNNIHNLSADELKILSAASSDIIRCAFRENSAFEVQKTRPYSRFSFSRLAQELHDMQPLIASVKFSLEDIISELTIPRLGTLTVEIKNV